MVAVCLVVGVGANGLLLSPCGPRADDCCGVRRVGGVRRRGGMCGAMAPVAGVSAVVASVDEADTGEIDSAAVRVVVAASVSE